VQKSVIFKKSSSAFTLIEMVMVLLLVGLLAVIVVPQFVNFGKDAKDAVTRMRLKELREAISGSAQSVSGGKFANSGFENDLGALPVALSELATIGAYAVYNPFTKIGWRGPYVNSAVDDWDKDAWGTSFSYNAGLRTLTSCGPDLACGNGDDIAIDI